MVSGDLYCRLLEFEEFLPEILRDAELREPSARFLGQMICHLQIDMIGWYKRLARPAFINNTRQFIRDIYTPAVIPAIFEPPG
ncbi:MAG: hypothetical protein DDT34_02500 [Firmicutes bacterium]|nr:hypothetical protein [Bacillota bacterium]